MSAERNANVRVLLVDGHDAARSALAKRLRRQRRLQVVAEVADAEEAAKLLPTTRPDIVLFDIPGGDRGAIEGCRMLHGLTEALIVVFTSFMTRDFWTAAQQAGAGDYLLKRIDTDRLGQEIVRLAEQHAAGLSLQRQSSGAED